MKPFLILILSLSFSITAIAQDSLGFTRKSEAKNIVNVHGEKIGKWIEYRDSTNHFTNDTNAPFYILAIFQNGTIVGLLRGYTKNGELLFQVPFVDGKENGVTKEYDSGALSYRVTYKNGLRNGIMKSFYK